MQDSIRQSGRQEMLPQMDSMQNEVVRLQTQLDSQSQLYLTEKKNLLIQNDNYVQHNQALQQQIANISQVNNEG